MEQERAADGLLLEMTGTDICRAGEPGLVRLAAVEWRVGRGDYWVIGGPPDAGKTDLLQTAAGLQRPARGSVRLFGHDVADLPELELLQQRTRVGFVFKGGGRIFADMTIAENIALPLRYHRNLSAEEALETVHALLDLTELGRIGSEYAQGLGAGARHRIGLARALALKPEIVFFDEPLAGMGWQHRQWWLDFLQRLAAGLPFMDGRRTAVAATTNDFAPWLGRAVCFAVLRDKRWQTLGEQKELPNI